MIVVNGTDHREEFLYFLLVVLLIYLLSLTPWGSIKIGKRGKK